MEGYEILNNLKAAMGKLMRKRLIVSSPSEKVADVPLLYAIVLVLATPFVCALAFVLGLILRYGMRVETELEKRTY